MTAHASTLQHVAPGEGINPAKMPGHWVLARAGKQVLRPGGRDLTRKMLAGLAITGRDDVVEFAPGMGATTRLAIAAQPRSYTAIERDEHAMAHVSTLLTGPGYACHRGTAQSTGLADECATVVFGEAFLTMQSDEHKRQIAAEAFRILRSGGRYGLHELALTPDTLDEEIQADIRGELSRSIHVGARPLTHAGWREILTEAGFEIVTEARAPMALLEPRRLLADEGISRLAKIALNILRDRTARARVDEMRAMFRNRAGNMDAIMVVARKPA